VINKNSDAFEKKTVKDTKAMKDLQEKVDALRNSWRTSKSSMEELENETNSLAKAVKESGDEFEKSGKKAILARNDSRAQIDAYKKYGQDIPTNLDKARKEVNKMALKADPLGFVESFGERYGEKIKKFASEAKAGADALMELGGVSTRTKEQFDGLLDGVMKVGDGLSQLATNPVSGAINIITGAIQFGSNVWKLFSEKDIRNAIDAERNFISISEET
jgi:seryl-tRNA synthetase